ncbi:hypothetical protein ON010_g6086 [Phytophthora cinnamomi]|nr:hypothetical protein ON010_g6086 [Phytophthora cinnamomi]
MPRYFTKRAYSQGNLETKNIGSPRLEAAPKRIRKNNATSPNSAFRGKLFDFVLCNNVKIAWHALNLHACFAHWPWCVDVGVKFRGMCLEYLVTNNANRTAHRELLEAEDRRTISQQMARSIKPRVSSTSRELRQSGRRRNRLGPTAGTSLQRAASPLCIEPQQAFWEFAGDPVVFSDC